MNIQHVHHEARLLRLAALSALLSAVFALVVPVVAASYIPDLPSSWRSGPVLEDYLLQLASLSQSERGIFVATTAVGGLRALFVIPIVLGLWFTLAETRSDVTLIATGLFFVGIPLSILDDVIFVPLNIGMFVRRFAEAPAEQRVALMDIFALAHQIRLALGAVSAFFRGAGIMLFSWVMLRTSIPRWVPIVGLLAGIFLFIRSYARWLLSVEGILGLGLAGSFGQVLVVLWFTGVGLVLYRRARSKETADSKLAMST